MKRVLILLMVCSLFLFSGCGRNEDELVMVTEAGFAPYEYYEDGEIVGIDVDIANEIAKEMGKKLVIKDVAFESVINEVISGKADFGAAGISYSDERAKKVDFTINYSDSNQVVIVKGDSNINGFSDITNKKIAVQLGTVADSFVSSNYKDATIVRQKKYLAAVEDLKNDKVEAIVMDELPAREILKHNDNLRLLDGTLTSDSYGMVVQKGNKELLDTINSVLERLKDEGKIKEFTINHLN